MWMTICRRADWRVESPEMKKKRNRKKNAWKRQGEEKEWTDQRERGSP